jgi:hypothetical protein
MMNVAIKLGKKEFISLISWKVLRSTKMKVMDLEDLYSYFLYFRLDFLDV